MADTTPSPKAVDGAEAPTSRPARPARASARPRRMRHAERSQGIPVDEAEVTDDGADPDVPSDDLGLSADEWATAAEELAREATETQDGAAEPEPTTWAQALRPPAAESPEPDADEVETPNAEAAGFRVKLRAAEAELQTTRACLESFQRAEVERMAGRQMANPSDLWLTGETALGDLLGESGDVDPKRVQEAVRGALAARPHWGRADPYRGMRSGATGRTEPQPASWASALGRPAE